VAEVIRIPPNINADGLFPLLSLLGNVKTPGPIVVDISELRRVTPAALVALAARVNGWKRSGRSVSFFGEADCPISSYLRRMDLFSACGTLGPNGSYSASEAGKFVPVRQIEPDTNKMGDEIASCIAPGGEEYDHPMAHLHSLAFYVFTEVANNVRQHSRGEGFIAAQVTRKDGFVRLALADNGRGILKSFQDAGFEWSEKMNHVDAVSKALEARISSSVSPVNEGVGLTLVTGLALLMKAWLLIVSGDGVFTVNPQGKTRRIDLPEGGFYQGTLMGVSFPQNAVIDFADMLHTAKVKAGLLQDSFVGINFKT
jgi:hypothetical protein